MWRSTDSETKHARSTAKQVVAFLKLFLPSGFVLDESSARYRDDVLETGSLAEKAMLVFLQQHSITARGAQNVLKSMRKLHKAGQLNEHIGKYLQLQAQGLITDPASPHTCGTIGLVTMNPPKTASAPRGSSRPCASLWQSPARSGLMMKQFVTFELLTMKTTVASASLLPEAIREAWLRLAVLDMPHRLGQEHATHVPVPRRVVVTIELVDSDLGAGVVRRGHGAWAHNMIRCMDLGT
ncbi:unnamed protein product [Phytophthora lilii]|uniref:Unnamed protein product n=1 Tax=Phytophthora lilii TaxID=2077276 RepID=A0A9W6TRR5_9STRA|nr:unnamed protein product [Phytophthora lilii]